jgi:hypothetical protein
MGWRRIRWPSEIEERTEEEMRAENEASRMLGILKTGKRYGGNCA